MNTSILIIDDDESFRRFLVDAFDEDSYLVLEAADGDRGLSMIRDSRPDIILLDVQMPGIDGTEVLREVSALDSTIAVIMITSVDEIGVVRESLKLGAYDYLIKPVELPNVFETVARAREQRELQLEIRRYRENLEGLVEERTRALRDALDRIEETYTQTILALGSALEMRDVETQAHSQRVSGYTIAICRKLGMNDKDRLTAIERGAFLHDIGKIGVPDRILNKPAALTEDEWVVMRTHPTIGVKLLEGIEFLRDSVSLVRSHHERWDGAGYPDGLSGTDIPIESRVFAVADALDAITSDRPYRARRSIGVAREIIAEASGTQFDPDVVTALAGISDEEFGRIRDGTGDYRRALS
ncbi:MAG: HD domain-containing phosphohydrolase [Spirochaetota bacterium]